MLRQWDRVLPLPIAVRRVGLALGIKDGPKRFKTPADAARRKELEGQSIEKLRALGVPIVPASALPKIIEFSDYVKMRA